MGQSSSHLSVSRKSALIIAHPGHELRVCRWLEIARPTVFVLTDGSGRSDKSRLSSTTTLLSAAGAQCGPVFGRFTDLRLYHNIIVGDSECFAKLAEELAEHLYEQQIEYVAGDAIEGYNPAHDLCRLIINAALRILNRRHGLSLGNFDFLLSGRPDACPERTRNQAIWLRLDDLQIGAKLNFARSYPELQPEVEKALSANGRDAFRIECLRPVAATTCYHFQGTPFYERYGEKRVAAGFYSDVIRYREHMVPLAEALRRHAERANPWA